MASLLPVLLPLLFLAPSWCILQGTVAKPESITYLASIRSKIEDSYSFGMGHLCGATLITRDVVLTTSQCLTAGETINYLKPRYFRVVGGHTNRTVEGVYHHVSDVSRIVHHEQANHYTNKHNLALVTMATPVPTTQRFFKPILLADKSPEVGAVCTIAGWGSDVATSNVNTNYTQQAMYGYVNVIQRKNCSVVSPLLPGGAICYTANETGGACNGDQGGPLICDGRLVGILMLMENCDAHNTSSYAVDVYQHLYWINGNVYKAPELLKNGVACIREAYLWILHIVLWSAWG